MTSSPSSTSPIAHGRMTLRIIPRHSSPPHAWCASFIAARYPACRVRHPYRADCRIALSESPSGIGFGASHHLRDVDGAHVLPLRVDRVELDGLLIVGHVHDGHRRPRCRSSRDHRHSIDRAVLGGDAELGDSRLEVREHEVPLPEDGDGGVDDPVAVDSADRDDRTRHRRLGCEREGHTRHRAGPIAQRRIRGDQRPLRAVDGVGRELTLLRLVEHLVVGIRRTERLREAEHLGAVGRRGRRSPSPSSSRRPRRRTSGARSTGRWTRRSAP